MPADYQRIEPSGHIVLDLEIAKDVDSVGGWDFTGEMGMACAVVYDVARDRTRMYDASELEDLQACLDRADQITTWNGWTFDLPVIYGVNRPEWEASQYPNRPGGADNRPLRERSHDLLKIVYESQGLVAGKWTPAHKGWKLPDVTEALNLGGKCEDGAMAPEMYRKGQWGKLFTYCMHDVYLTTKVEQFARKYGFLKNKNNKVVMVPRFPKKAA